MRRTLPPLTALRAFEAAARHMSFQTAAAELAVTPTAISHQIRELEEACGQPLFRRRPRPLVLTDAGHRLFPVVRDGLDAFADAVAAIQATKPAKEDLRPLRVTATNAFTHLWLVPRLSLWRAAQPVLPLEVIGTDAALDLRPGGEADVAIRYTRAPPPGLAAREILRDRFWPVASPALLAHGTPITHPADLLQHTLIHAEWAPDPSAPTWERWLSTARHNDPDVPDLGATRGLHFREELHAIRAAIAGQGVAICSDVLVARDLKAGLLVVAHDLPLAGYGFYVVHARDHPRLAAIEAFVAWVRTATTDTDQGAAA
ncbi:LysR substrate-binding domain-containing protein [Sabulicella glaciei]|uniref:LysR substrate-binding domain-containing protein n=2 Tax=Sabulicella glaciei TaxID=2984948 RepID=A0ABT3P1W3_9PROT|nr:LysR substrate-binding domain-containing protein [Roseococcus sp. MDT2-1-1]MCW8088391.1 LysR substrate-binding domain-containing protein [Roseococcus sp. MDT2-1-1]